ncbi:MAG TPA: hypothetical protein VFR19_05845 [Hyphomicrobiaceae bacterium]|jgi:hypothetical protein|nr:hypothetical protein [Hyphomicrobiaceae bacterium]
MRIWHLALPLVIMACPLAAHAQSAAQPKSEPATGTAPTGTVPKADCRGTPETIRACGEAWFKDCLKDWDSATHMSKSDYAKTCRRVVDSRVKALTEQGRTDDGGKRKSAVGRP